MPNAPHGSEPPRRGFFKQLAVASSALPLMGGAASGVAMPAQAAATPEAAATLPDPLPGYQSFSPDEAAFVEALVDTLCPADAYTPSGVDCGLAVYIDRQLAGSFGQGDRRYRQGPFQPGKPQFGWQFPLSPEQFFKAGVAAANAELRRRGKSTLDELPTPEADAFLHELAEGRVKTEELDLGVWFNELVYPLFNEACFSDPIYGGNNGKVFWKLIGYPGLPATHALDIVQFRDKPFPGSSKPMSIADFS
ncbi:MAG: gluconate 2-dehydrogenase subunit 3 family protein [Curvibacter sp.]|nr:gluconate 2-dehydrogenase subunit 3 family protein [Curvibacter sp.]